MTQGVALGYMIEGFQPIVRCDIVTQGVALGYMITGFQPRRCLLLKIPLFPSAVCDGLADAYELGEEVFQEVEPEHVGAVAFGGFGLWVGLDEEAVGADGDACFGHGLDEAGHASGDSARLVGLLEGVGGIEDDGVAEGLHLWDAAVVDDEVLVAEGGAAFGEHDVGIAGFGHFLGGEAHGLGGEELAFLDVYGSACAGGGYEQVGLAAEEGGDLEDVDVLGGEVGFLCRVDVGDGGDAEGAADFFEHFQGFLVADAGEGVEAGAVGLAVGAFECVGDAQAVGDADDVFGDAHGHLFAFDDAGAGEQEEVAGGVMGQFFHDVWVFNLGYKFYVMGL